MTLFESESERVMEDGKRGTLEENIESRGEPLLPADVSWRLNLQEFPALPERRDEHGSIILRRFRRTTGQPSSQILMYICIIFFILFSKGFLLFLFFVVVVVVFFFFFLGEFYNGQAICQYRMKVLLLVFFFFLPRFKTQMQFCSKMLFFRFFSVKQLMYILIYVFIIYLILCSKRYWLFCFCFSLYKHKVQ